MKKIKTLYESDVYSIESIQEGLINIINNNSKNKIIAVIVSIKDNDRFYNITSIMFIDNTIDSVERCLIIVKSRIFTFNIKYRISDPEYLRIVGREYFSDSVYAKMMDDKVRDNVMDELVNIQERINNIHKYTHDSTNADTILKEINDKSKAVSKGVLIDTPLEYHNRIYSIKDPCVKIKEYYDKNITDISSENKYIKSFKVVINKNGVIIKWIDHFFITEFHREYNDITLIFDIPNKSCGPAKIINFRARYNFPSLRKNYAKDEINSNIGVIDIETYLTEDNIIIPYAAGFKINDVDGSGVTKIKTFYGKQCVVEIITYIYNSPVIQNFTFYAHNLDFDGPFIVKAILSIDTKLINGTIPPYNKIKIIINDDKDIIKINYNKITYLDSFKMIPSSLAYLAKEFNVKSGYKTLFPYDFITEDKIYYKGPKPDIKYYNKGQIVEYEYAKISPIFDTQIETIEYIKNDINILFDIVMEIQNILWNYFRIEITSVSTIASLSFKIYISKYYKNSYDVRNINGQVANDLRIGHYGGITQVYRRKVINGYYYDINSQYPSAIRNIIPTGNPTFTTFVDVNNMFGFFNVSVVPTSDKNIFIPVRTNAGTIIFTTEEFSGWYFSEEIKKMYTLNWKVKVNYGYQFNSSSGIFTEFVEDIYSKRLQNKNIGNNTVAIIIKLIINSLYGRMAFYPPTTSTSVIKNSSLDRFKIKHTVIHEIAINDIYSIVQYDKKVNKKLITLLPQSFESTVLSTTHSNSESRSPVSYPVKSTISYTQSSIPLAAATTAYARISIYQYKEIEFNQPIYTDTDSVVLQKEIDPSYLSDTELGKIRTPIHFDEGIFLAPKVYSLKLKDGTYITRIAGINSSYLSHSIFQSIALGHVVEINGVKIFERNGENFER